MSIPGERYRNIKWARSTDRMLDQLEKDYRPIQFSDEIPPEATDKLEGKLPSHTRVIPLTVWDVEERRADIALWPIVLN